MDLRTYSCPLAFTNKAKDKMRELGLGERSLFSREKPFSIWIEKYPEAAGRPFSVALFFHLADSAHLVEKSVLVLHCAVEKTGFVLINVTARPAHAPVETNWRREVRLSFDEKVTVVPLPLLTLIRDMPVAQESSAYVKKRIASWEGYLKIEERQADIPDMTARYSGIEFNSDFSRMTLLGCNLEEKEWKAVRGLSVRIAGIEGDAGKVLKANRPARSVEVELPNHLVQRARQQGFDTPNKEVVFSNFAALSQVKRLRQGFKHLENGLAANPDLERLLFENKPPVRVPKKQPALAFHNRLNDFQKKAVEGAMAAEDLYVIQGPPGTGKTTVISEICLQNARAGLRTLVASQSNLAVDNALGRLLAHQDIRILRVGRTESIEEEGKKFIEENVGQYWKTHTLAEVAAEVDARKKRGPELEAEWAENEKALQEIEPLITEAKAAVEAKKQAEQARDTAESELSDFKQQLDQLKAAQEELENKLGDRSEALLTLSGQIKQDELLVQNAPSPEALEAELSAAEKAIQQAEQFLSTEQLKKKMQDVQASAEQAEADAKASAAEVERIEAVIQKAAAAGHIDSVKWLILEQNIERTPELLDLMADLDEMRGRIDQFNKLKEYSEQLSRAIAYMEKLAPGLPLEQFGQRANQASYSAEAIDDFLDQLRSDLKQNPRLQPQAVAAALEGLHSRRNFVWKKAKQRPVDEATKSKAKSAFQQVKQEVTGQFARRQAEKSADYRFFQQLLQRKKAELAAAKKEYEQLAEMVQPVTNAEEVLAENSAAKQALEKRKAETVKAASRLFENKQRFEQGTKKLKEIKQQLTESAGQAEAIQSSIQTREKTIAALQAGLAHDAEAALEEQLKKLASLSFARESLKQEKKKWPLLQSVQTKWLSLLESASDHDVDEIRKLYVKHANVIGTTCVASARKDFIDQYPVFDVVIIDEVSKATPPELLLPMLKGKKIILVGDHHQLPPLLGSDTLEETLQEMADGSQEFEGKAELKQLLKESLFERLFKTLPETNKTMLAIQYRMHETIMSTIAPFYKRESDQLQCGLPDSDAARDHLLDSPRVGRSNHLLWLDMPNEPAFFEEKMKGGKSLFNPAELREISALLQELNDAAARAKEKGLMAQAAQKSVGVISFYGEQVKRIQRMIDQELRLPHVTVRTGTVDRFQGMEMDVILLSMVRNHANKQEDIGFAKDYRRLNVALSRAKELLVLIGSTKMFTERTKQADTKQMYKHVLETVKQSSGLRKLQESRR